MTQRWCCSLFFTHRFIYHLRVNVDISAIFHLLDSSHFAAELPTPNQIMCKWMSKINFWRSDKSIHQFHEIVNQYHGLWSTACYAYSIRILSGIDSIPCDSIFKPKCFSAFQAIRSGRSFFFEQRILMLTHDNLIMCARDSFCTIKWP